MDHGFMDSEGTLKRNQKRCMRFRKHCSLLAECEIYTFLLAVLCVSMIEIHSWIVVITSIMLLLMAIYPILFNEYILISESGICCTKQQKIQWSFSWEDISELRKSRRFHQNSIDIIISNTSDRKCNFQEYYFQLGPTAKAALRKYYNSPTNLP